MPNKLVRSFGATVILAALGVVAFLQVGGREPATAVDIVAEATPISTTTILPGGSAAEPSVVPDEPFVYQVGLLGSPTTANFWSYFADPPTVWDAYVLAPTKGSLFRVDPQTQTLVPELAGAPATPTWDADGWRVRVKLRGDGIWSDGEPITAHDFAFTFSTVRALDLGGQWAGVFPDAVSTVTAIDDYTLDISFIGRPGLEVWPYGVGTAPVMASHFWAPLAAGPAADELLSHDGSGDPSSGPLDLVELTADRIVSRANPGYRGAVADIVEYRVYPGIGAMIEALGDGQIHTMLSPRGLTAAEAETVSVMTGVTQVTSPVFGIRYLSFNLDRAPMSDLEFRAAVAVLVDRETLARDVAGVEAAATLLPASSDAWWDPEMAAAIPRRDIDPVASFESALAGLEQAGYSWSKPPAITPEGAVPGEGLRIDGSVPAALTILTSGDAYDPQRAEYAERVAEAVSMLGFEVIPVTTDFDTVIDLTFTPDEAGELRYDMAILGWTLGNPGLPSFYAEMLGTDAAANNTGYSSAEMDALLGLYASAHDVDTARSRVWEIETLLARDIPYLPLYASQIVEAYRSDTVTFADAPGIGGIQGALGAIQGVSPTGD